jgi:hypothetical protein
MSNRWAFESLGRSVDLDALLANGASPLGPPLLEQYRHSFSRAPAETWLVLAAFALFFLAATCVALARRTASLSG